MVRALSRSRSNSGTHMKSALARSPTKEAQPIKPKSLSERLSNTLLGVKGSSLSRTYDFDENPMTRLKLLLVRTTPLSQANMALLTRAVPLTTDRIVPHPPHP